MCHAKDCAEVFEANWQAGQDYGLTPMGLEALDMVRIEAYVGFTVPLSTKENDFIDRDALIWRKAHPARKLVGLVIDVQVDVGHGDSVHSGRAQIGEVMSSMRAPLFGKTIALARVDVADADLGTQLQIGKLDGQQKRLPALVAPFAHCDPQKKRPRAEI